MSRRSAAFHCARWTSLAGIALSLACTSACKSNDSTATGPSPTTSPSGPSSTVLPYGTANGAVTSCPSGSPGSTTCTRLTISCPSVPTIGSVLRITAATGSNRGTIVLTTGGDGTAFERTTSTLAPAMMASFTADGLAVVELAWDAPGVWGGPQARTLACRAATAVKWIYDNVHGGARSRLFAAQGTSGGASQIGFGLAHYGLGDLLDLANLGGGPPGCPLCSADGQHASEPLLPGSPPSNNRDPLLNYPSTVVRFFLGDQEPGTDIVMDANAYFAAITSAKSFTVVPGTAHNIEQTQAGVDAFVAAVHAALK